MTLVREYQPTFVLGDGETKEFSYLFEEVSENFIKVIVKHSDDSTYTPVFSVDLDSHKVVFGESETAPLDTDIICIYRETPDLQDTPFRTLQGYDAKALENILSKIVAMIQELKANGFSTQILQGTPWQLDLLHPADDGASVVVDYNARILKKGLYFQIVSGNLQVSADGNNFITMPKSADITEFRRLETVLEDLTVQYRLQYKVDGVWYNAESNAEATADEALQVAQDAKDIAQAASDKVDTFDVRLTQAEEDSSDAKQDASDAKDIAQTASDAVSGHITDTNNPHSVTAAQTGALPNTTKYGANLSLTVDSTTYVVTAQLKDQDGNNLGIAQTIDLPLESVVVSGSYDSATKEVVLTLQGGSTIRFSVADLVSGLQTEITALNMLSADLVDDTNTTHKFVTTTEKSTWSGKQDAISDLATIRSGAAAGATAVQPGDLATVATSGSYTDLSNKPTIPAAQVNSDWDAISGVAKIFNKPTIPTVDQTYDATSANAQSGVAINGANFLVNNAAGSTNGVAIKGSGGIQSTQIGALGSAVSMSTSVGFSCFASGTQSIAVGHGSQATASKSYAFGEQAKSTAIGAFQFGQATNNEAGSVYFGLTLDGNTTNNYKLLGSDGLIPDARISSNIARTSDLATVATSGSYNDLSDKPTIPTVNNPTITITQGGVTKGSFTLNQSSGDTIALDAGGGGGSVAIDDLTITKNSDDEIQAVATVNANTATGATNPVYDWVGTLAEYQAQNIETLHPDWICYITDDVSGGASVYTKTEVDNNFVGKGHQVIAFQAPTSENNYTWYRKYADGWVEQGGMNSYGTGTTSNTVIPLLVPMASTLYDTITSAYEGAAGSLCPVIAKPMATSTSTTLEVLCCYSDGGTLHAWGGRFTWRVSGMAA